MVETFCYVNFEGWEVFC